MDRLNIGSAWFPVTTLGYGDRLGVWVQGCGRNCRNCISPELQPFVKRYACSYDEILDIIPAGAQVDGLTVSGGEPFDQEEALLDLVMGFSDRYCDDILIFTGYTAKALHEKGSQTIEKILSYIAVLIDGQYMEEKNTGRGLQGSSNQVIHVLKHKERYKDAEEWRRSMQCVISEDHLWMIGIPPN